MAWPTMPSITWENAALDLPSIDGEDIIIILLLNVGVYWHMDHGRLSCMSYMSKVGLNRSSAHLTATLVGDPRRQLKSLKPSCLQHATRTDDFGT